MRQSLEVDTGAPLIESPPSISSENIKRCWSIKRNARYLFGRTESRYAVLDGVRALSVLWVVLNHTDLYYPNHTFSFSNSFPVRFMKNGAYGVDSFFVLSGFLIYYILNKEYKQKNTVNLSRFYLRRFLRIAPAYYLCLAIFWVLCSRFNQPQYDNCVRYWWSNLFFFNNFMPLEHQCMGWAWSIAVEIHYYVISPFIVYGINRYRTYAKRILYGSVVFFTMLRFALTYYFGSYLGGQENWMQGVYYTPWCRISPFIVGMLTCIHIEEAQIAKGTAQGEEEAQKGEEEREETGESGFDAGTENRREPRRYFALFLLACVILFVTGGVWAFFNEVDPMWSIIPALVFGPLIISIGVAYVIYYLQIYATERNYLKKFLSLRAMGVIAQLSYGMYLTGPIFQEIMFYNLTDLPNASFWLLIGWWLFFCVSSFICAVFVYFVIEKPLMLIFK